MWEYLANDPHCTAEHQVTWSCVGSVCSHIIMETLLWVAGREDSGIRDQSPNYPFQWEKQKYVRRLFAIQSRSEQSAKWAATFIWSLWDNRKSAIQEERSSDVRRTRLVQLQSMHPGWTSLVQLSYQVCLCDKSLLFWCGLNHSAQHQTCPLDVNFCHLFSNIWNPAQNYKICSFPGSVKHKWRAFFEVVRGTALVSCFSNNNFGWKTQRACTGSCELSAMHGAGVSGDGLVLKPNLLGWTGASHTGIQCDL